MVLFAEDLTEHSKFCILDALEGKVRGCRVNNYSVGCGVQRMGWMGIGGRK